jgi:mono/diheme cytochrome c family protein
MNSRNRALSISGFLGFLFLTAGVFAAQPAPRPKIPDPISPIFPTMPGGPALPGTPSKGDPQRGLQIYQSWGCVNCHTNDGKGGKMGPDLARVGETHSDPYWFRRYLSDPRSIIPTSVKPPVKLPDADMDDLIAYLQSLKLFPSRLPGGGMQR